MKRYYDRRGNRLVYIGERADSEYWDKHWITTAGNVTSNQRLPKRSLVIRTTKRFLSRGSLILEGGCGTAINSWHLLQLGYRVLALDFAPATMAAVRRRIPDVRPVLGSVERLPLRDALVDGYWSLGVIEHDYAGFDLMAAEMTRVVRTGGFLFLTFPHMSRLRRLKARYGAYDAWTGDPALQTRFYQFALDERDVIRQFEALRWRVVHQERFLGATGLEQEIEPIRRLLRPSGVATGTLRYLMDLGFRWFSSHCVLLVFWKPLSCCVD